MFPENPDAGGRQPRLTQLQQPGPRQVGLGTSQPRRFGGRKNWARSPRTVSALVTQVPQDKHHGPDGCHMVVT